MSGRRGPEGRLPLDEGEIEYRRIEGDPALPALVFLHEGLGSAALWRDFPDRVAAETGAAALVYSRLGYGGSSLPAGVAFPIDYMHVEAERRLPAILSALDIERPLLVGHSDGASIALIHAGAFPDAVAGLVVMAPHVFVEECSLRAIAEARRAFDKGGLDKRLARWHRDAAGTFDAWNGAWLDPRFRGWNIESRLPGITAPLLAFQGEADPYGTRGQTDRIAAQVSGPAETVLLPGCGHTPWREAGEAVLPALAAFAGRIAGAEARRRLRRRDSPLPGRGEDRGQGR